MTSPSLRSVLTEIADKLTWRDDTERLRFHDRIAAATAPFTPSAPPVPPAPVSQPTPTVVPPYTAAPAAPPVPPPPYTPTQPTPGDPYPTQ